MILENKQVNTIQGLINLINKANKKIEEESKDGVYSFYNSEKLDKILINTETFFLYYAKGFLPSQTESYQVLKNSFGTFKASLEKCCKAQNNEIRNKKIQKYIENNTKQISKIEQSAQECQG